MSSKKTTSLTSANHQYRIVSSNLILLLPYKILFGVRRSTAIFLFPERKDIHLISVSRRDFTPGLTYVAISRVKTLDGVLFEEPFDFDRFRRQVESVYRRRTEMTARRTRPE